MNIRAFQDIKPTISSSAYVDPLAVVIGNVTIGQDSSIWPFASIRGDIHQISIGERTSIQDGTVIHVTHASDYYPGGFGVSVGNDVTVGHRVTLHGCTVKDFVIVGMGSIILDGVVIEPEVIVGAGSLVPPGKVLTSGLWVGTPVVRKRDLTPNELDFLRYSAQSYVKLKNKYFSI